MNSFFIKIQLIVCLVIMMNLMLIPEGNAQETGLLEVSRVEIRFNHGLSFEMGLVAGSRCRPLERATIILYRSEVQVLALPVTVKMDSLGLTLKCGFGWDGAITLTDFDGKKLKDLFGKYSGVQVGLSYVIGVGGAWARNQSGVGIRNGDVKVSNLGAEISFLKIFVSSEIVDSRYDFILKSDFDPKIEESQNIDYSKINCQTSFYLAVEGDLDLYEGFIENSSFSTREECFKYAITRAQQRDFYVAVSGQPERNYRRYVAWEFNDGWIDDCNGYVTRFTDGNTPETGYMLVDPNGRKFYDGW